MSDATRFSFEYPNDDFPFYNGQPVAISPLKWLFVMAMVALGFAALTAPIPFFTTDAGRFIPALLFPIIPLVGLAIVAPAHWTYIFRRIGVRDVLWMFGFAALNMVVVSIVALISLRIFQSNANPVAGMLAHQSQLGIALFYLMTIPQLFGEEVLTILPFLALLNLFYAKLNLSRKQAIIVAWLLSAVLFGAVHLPTYGWNVPQCMIIIGSARLVLLLAYLKTKNIWVSTGAHIINDWIIFTIAVLGAAAAK